ncbi:MAG: peptidoglycan bridge formation glycyltransferase FemA/FemB family protein [Candidatus Marinimicrobia bacterium]|nr:peptidoglycan bridge formation glycyltransferase FemA/FemB family protein [Candidatus Neomarinimicrobiota bacterium]
MDTFEIFRSKDEGRAWDKMLICFRDYNFQQKYSFGEYEKSKGQEIFRAVLFKGGQSVVMGQGILRRPFPYFSLLTIRRGPVYQATDSEKANLNNLRTFLRLMISYFRARNKLLYINCLFPNERSVTCEIAIREAGFTKPLLERSPHLTTVVTIEKDILKNSKLFHSKWRNQLRRAESLRPVFTWGNSEDLLNTYVKVHNSMCKLKSMQNYSISREELFSLREMLSDNIHFLIGKHDDQAVCGCLVITLGEKAFYYYAAANSIGRKYYFSNAMIWKLIEKLNEIGISELDMSGIDPIANWGGYNFKKGVGGKLIAYQGEWEYVSSWLLKLILNLYQLQKTKNLYN